MSDIYPPPPPPYEPPNPPPYTPLNPTAPTHVKGVRLPGYSTTVVTGSNYGSIPSSSGHTTIVVEAVPATSVLLVGGCPACRVGVLNEEFSLGGLCCAFWFFPLGILCCLLMRERRCTNCSATFPL
ncbi:Brain protein I3 [Trinorchestia longiramus]|nr:Brain protein I3 [Trinorchestia longiramus]